MPRLSVIVPVYNVEKYLDNCIQSILNQKFIDLELILVDDGSPDNSLAICESWAKKDNRVQVIHQKNSGVSAARNAGLKAISAQSEYFTFVDSDDTIEENYYSHAFNTIDKTGCDIYSSNLKIVDGDGNMVNVLAMKDFVIKNQRDIKPYLKEYFETSFFTTCTKLYKTALLKKSDIKFNVDFKTGEDPIFNYEIFAVAKHVVHQDVAFYHYYQHHNMSLGRKGDVLLYQTAKRRMFYLNKYLCDIGLEEMAEEVIGQELDTCAYSQYYQLINPNTYLNYSERYFYLKQLYDDKQVHRSLKKVVNTEPLSLAVLLSKISIYTKIKSIVLLPSKIVHLSKGEPNATNQCDSTNL